MCVWSVVIFLLLPNWSNLPFEHVWTATKKCGLYYQSRHPMTTQKYHSNEFEPNTTQDRMTTEQTRTLLAMEA